MNELKTDTAPFPPEEIGAFLRCCAGEWMGLRSQFALGEVSAGDTDDDGWHTSDRGELMVAFLEPDTPDGPGGLQVGAKDGTAQQLQFSADGAFRNGAQQGRWQLWPDGSLELSLSSGDAEVRERIWFTKPNLRLRSTVESRADGSPGRASFSSEIRRVRRPAEPAS